MTSSDLARALAERVVFVLVEPQHPGNVGAAARAMRNMGLERLVVVAPPAYDPEQARWMAPGCADLLAAAPIVADLDDALRGVHRVVAATARHRRLDPRILDPARIAAEILDGDQVWAVLFGREDSGLSQQHVARSESILRIPTPEHASLNLSQAVLIVAAALFEEARRRGLEATGRTVGGSRSKRSTASLQRPSPRDRTADVPELEPAVGELIELLERVGYLRGGAPLKVRATARQALQRAGPSVRHIEALRGMIGRVQWALDHPGADWRKKSGGS